MSSPTVSSLKASIEERGTKREYQQIVIGAGSSALTFLHSAFHGSESAMFSKQSTLVIGQDDLWARTTPSHIVGQPSSLLTTLPGTVRPGMEGPMSPGDSSVTPQPFLKAGGIVEHNQALKTRIEKDRATSGRQLTLRFLNDTVKEVSRKGRIYEVLTERNGTFQAGQVIVASGIGAQKGLSSIKLTVQNEGKLKDGSRSYPEVTDAVTYYNSTSPAGLDVLIYGGSATSSWSAADATAMKCNYTWICRKGISQISVEGNPAGRNSPIILEATKAGRILQGEIKTIEIVDPIVVGGPRVKVSFETETEVWTKREFPETVILQQPDAEIEWTKTGPGKWVKSKETASSQPVRQLRTMRASKVKQIPPARLFHQLVYAIGSDPMALGGPGQILSKAIKDKLEVVWDKDYRHRSSGDESVIALWIPDGTFWVVGAAVFGGLGVDRLKSLSDSYKRQGDMLPHAGRPPEGIPILTYAIKKLTGHLQTGAAINIDKATPMEIYQELVRVFRPETPKEILEDMTESILNVRADSKFAIPWSEIENIMGYYMETFGILPRASE